MYICLHICIYVRVYIYIYIYIDIHIHTHYIVIITIHNFEDTKFTFAFSRVFLVFLALTVAVQ